MSIIPPTIKAMFLEAPQKAAKCLTNVILLSSLRLRFQGTRIVRNEEGETVQCPRSLNDLNGILDDIAELKDTHFLEILSRLTNEQ